MRRVYSDQTRERVRTVADADAHRDLRVGVVGEAQRLVGRDEGRDVVGVVLRDLGAVRVGDDGDERSSRSRQRRRRRGSSASPGRGTCTSSAATTIAFCVPVIAAPVDVRLRRARARVARARRPPSRDRRSGGTSRDTRPTRGAPSRCACLLPSANGGGFRTSVGSVEMTCAGSAPSPRRRPAAVVVRGLRAGTAARDEREAERTQRRDARRAR